MSPISSPSERHRGAWDSADHIIQTTQVTQEHFQYVQSDNTGELHLYLKNRVSMSRQATGHVVTTRQGAESGLLGSIPESGTDLL